MAAWPFLPLFGQEAFLLLIADGFLPQLRKFASTARTMISGKGPVLTGAWKFFRGRGRVRD